MQGTSDWSEAGEWRLRSCQSTFVNICSSLGSLIYHISIVERREVNCIMDSSDTGECFIKKEIIYPGSKFVPFVDGTRVNFANATHSEQCKSTRYACIFQVKFHYQTKTCPESGDGVLIDDSKKCGGRPMELVIGKKFKFEVWEVIVQKMSLNEVAKFRVHKSVRVKRIRYATQKTESIESHCSWWLNIHSYRRHCETWAGRARSVSTAAAWPYRMKASDTRIWTNCSRNPAIWNS